MNFLKDLSLGSPPMAGELERLPFFDRIPKDYLEFMTTANGGHGSVGKEHLVIFKVGEIAVLNKAACVEQYAPHLLIFASNGGGQSYAFDFRREKVGIVKLFDMDLGDEEPEWCADNFGDFLRYLFEQP